MPTSSFRVAATFLRKSADDDAAERDLALREQEEDKVISPGLFVDLMGFFVALGAYQKMRGEGDEHLVGVRGLLTRYQDELVAGLQRFFVPLAEDPLFARFKSRLHLAARPSRGLAQAALQVEVISDVLQALHSKPNLLREVLPDNRAYLAAVKLANLLVNEAPETVLNGLATIPPASRLTVTRKWVREAAERAGVAPSDTESTIADAAAAHDIGEDIHRVEVDLASADQVSPAAAALQDRKRDLLGQVDAVASTSPNPSVVVAAVASTAAKPADYATTIGRKQGLSPEQEQAMLIRGKGIIAAGAGSGKTRVLSSKVAYHVNELGLPVSAVLATSFSKKSAAELRQKIEKCGVDIPNAADTGFGTTHKIAAAIRTEYGGGTGEYLKPYETSSAIRIAMAQVQMTSPNAGKPPPPTSLFAGLLPAGGGTPPDPAEDAPPSPADLTGLSFREACELAFKQRNRLGNSFLTSFIADLFNQSSLWYGKNMRATQDLKNPRGFSEKQQDIIIDIFNRLRIPYDPDTDPVLNGTRKTAAKDKNKSLRDRYPTFTRPVNQWFNLGLKLEEEGPGGVKKPIPPGTFARAITKWKGRAVSPSEAWAEGQSAEAAVYAAYEFLKGPNGETDFVNKGDFDDGLLDASKMLLSNPRALAQVQSRFKLVLVDEAQDLNRAQHLLFGLVAGYVDPAKAHEIGKAKKMSQVAKHDNSITADTYCFIGDDKQCVEANSVVDTVGGSLPVRDLSPGTLIRAYRNGKVEFQTVRHVMPSSWTWGYKVTLESGQSLTMSPNHKLWASEPQTEDGQMAVYLMYRKDMGFRIGITNKGKVGSEDDYLNSYGGRAFMEKAERMWILDIVDGREEALLRELDYSLEYGVPTTVFGGENRGLNQERIDLIFKKHGHKGARLLEDLHLSFDLPHWMSQSYTKHGRERHTIQFLAHSTTGSQVLMEWEGDKFDEVLAGMGVTPVGNRRRLRKYCKNYRDGLRLAETLAQRTGANLSHRLSTPEESLRETTAAGLFVGMRVPVLDGEGITLECISSIEKVDGTFIDLDVDDASNFFANDILTHNSIYEFRSADPEAFIDMSDLVEGGAGFTTKVLKTNYRSGKNIVEAANRLVSFNKKQIPMVCNANPARANTGGIERIPFDPVSGSDMDAPAEWLAERIAEDHEQGLAGPHGYDSYGVGLRSNAEAYTYGLALLEKGIPFRSKANFFKDPSAKALICWLTIADEGINGDVDRINEAVLGARGAPATMLGDKFVEKVEAKATGNYLKWLETDWGQVYGTYGDWSSKVKGYTDNLLKVAAMKGKSSDETLTEVLSLTGFDGQSMLDALVTKIEGDEDRLEELRKESPDGKVSPEALAEAALAPVKPLKKLISTRANLAEAMKYVRKLRQANESLATDDDPDAKGFKEPAVTLGTMHSWKGLEVSTMFVPVVGGRFPRRDSDEDALASERRLAYVALTRGENQVYVLDIPTITPGRKGVPPQITHSQFLDEMCIPTRGAKPSGDPDKMARVAGASPWDEDEMDAYLRGERP